MRQERMRTTTRPGGDQRVHEDASEARSREEGGTLAEGVGQVTRLRKDRPMRTPTMVETGPGTERQNTVSDNNQETAHFPRSRAESPIVSRGTRQEWQ